jgi:ribosomal protein S18 acetylase RimI-like enzyme
MRLCRVDARAARQQAEWIVRLEPWHSLGYRRARLGAWLARQAQAGRVRAAMRGKAALGLVVAQPDFLLGHFIALLAVRPESSGQGLGRALIEDAAGRAGQRRWLYASCDSTNRLALGFYRRLGFERVGRLPHLIQRGRTEILLRRPTPRGAETV